MKRFLAALILLVLFVGGLWWWSNVASSSADGMNAVERWCAGQLQRIADDLLGPKLEFKTLKLKLPATVTLTEVTLTSDGVAFMRMGSMKLEFRETPKQGQPLIIKSATFIDPEVRLIEQADGDLLGFSGFVKSTDGEAYDDGGSSKPSDIFAIRQIGISNGVFEWVPAGYDNPMRFEQLSMDLQTDSNADRPGWYDFDATIERPPVIELSWDGGINIDTGDLDFHDVTLRASLDEDQYGTLTPQIQQFLRRHQIVGELVLHVTGRVPLNDGAGADLTFDASLQNSNATVGEYQFPVESAQMQATLREMRFAFDPLTINAFSGRIESSGFFRFDDLEPFQIRAKAVDVLLQQMLSPAASEDSKFAGKMDMTLEVNGNNTDVANTLYGEGEITLQEAKLVNIPMFNALANAMKLTSAQRDAGTDSANAQFTLKGDRATVDKGDVQGTAIAGRGRGDIYYDGRLDLKVNAGLLEKAQGLLGPVGDIFAAITDKLLPYRVTGTWEEPVVTPQPLGIPLGGK